MRLIQPCVRVNFWQYSSSSLILFNFWSRLILRLYVKWRAYYISLQRKHTLYQVRYSIKPGVCSPRAGSRYLSSKDLWQENKKCHHHRDMAYEVINSHHHSHHYSEHSTDHEIHCLTPAHSTPPLSHRLFHPMPEGPEGIGVEHIVSRAKGAHYDPNDVDAPECKCSY